MHCSGEGLPGSVKLSHGASERAPESAAQQHGLCECFWRVWGLISAAVDSDQSSQRVPAAPQALAVLPAAPLVLERKSCTWEQQGLITRTHLCSLCTGAGLGGAARDCGTGAPAHTEDPGGVPGHVEGLNMSV